MDGKLSRLARAYWRSGDCLYAWTLTLLVTACTIIIVLLSMLLNKWQVGFYNQLQSYNFPAFLNSLAQFIAIAGVYVFVSGYQSYFHLSLEMRWRHWLTNQYITMWLNNHGYYRLNLTNTTINPDQRISEDVRIFIDFTLDLAIGLLRHTVTLLVFSVVLWQLSGTITFTLSDHDITIPGYLLWLALLYSIVGTSFVVRAGRPLVARNVAQQSNEAEFRSRLARINSSGECIALYGGEKTEQLHLTACFHTIINNYRQIIKHTRSITFLSTARTQLSIVFAFLIAAPRYFNQELQLGQLFEISGAYWYVHSALSYIIDSFKKIALWRAVSNRLNSFSFQLSKAGQLHDTRGVITFTRQHHIKLKNLTLLSSANQVLISNLSLELKPKDRLLLSGPNGSGKSTLLRTIAGLWPYFSGTIIKPADKAVMFLPQKFYAPPGSLRDVLSYPYGQTLLPDKHLHEILEHCHLSRLVGKLDTVADWEKKLSGGEQQCLAFARAILRRPDWLFLDEATSNMDERTEHSLYRLLAEALPDLTLVSICHRESLRFYHTLNLHLDGDGAWLTEVLDHGKPHAPKRALWR